VACLQHAGNAHDAVAGSEKCTEPEDKSIPTIDRQDQLAYQSNGLHNQAPSQFAQRRELFFKLKSKHMPAKTVSRRYQNC
jgi:hypothetical protein